MRTYLGTASLLVASAHAFEWTDVLSAMQTFNLAEATNSVKDFDIHQYVPKVTTRADANKWIEEKGRHIAPLSKEHRREAINAHHRTMNRRERLGLPKMGAGAGPIVGQNFLMVNSFSGYFLNVLQGMQYNTSGTNSKCYDAFESSVIALDTTSDILAKMYIPAYWAEAQVQVQDLVAVSSTVFVDCNVDKMFNTLTHLATTEGVSELSARVAGAFMFEISKCMDVYSKPDEYTTQESGQAYGKCLSILLNFTI